MKLQCAWACALQLLWVSSVAAGPSHFWGRVYAPQRESEYRLWVTAERSRGQRVSTLASERLSQKMNERAALVLQLAGVEKWGGERLSFLLGEALVLAGAAYRPEGREVLERALLRFPESAWAPQARFQIVASLADEGLRLPPELLETTLRDVWEPLARTQLLIWFGVDGLRRGEFSRAVLDLGQSAQQHADGPVVLLGRYGLAVALDLDFRTGEALPLALAAAQARFGAQGEQGILELPLAQFLKEVERFYFRGLAAHARALNATDPAVTISELQESQLMWMTFVQSVGPEHPWLPRARFHLGRAKAELHRLMPAKAKPNEDPDWILRLEKEQQQSAP